MCSSCMPDCCEVAHIDCGCVSTHDEKVFCKFSIAYKSYITIIKELSGNERSE